MPPLLKFLARRLLAIPVTLLIVTSALYGIIMLAPAETRAQLYSEPEGGASKIVYPASKVGYGFPQINTDFFTAKARRR